MFGVFNEKDESGQSREGCIVVNRLLKKSVKHLCVPRFSGKEVDIFGDNTHFNEKGATLFIAIPQSTFFFHFYQILYYLPCIIIHKLSYL